MKRTLKKGSKSKQSKRKRVMCLNCKHYYITWDQRFPHGCRAMGFKSHVPPYLTVFQSSGMPCQLFEEKEDKAK